MFLTKMFKESKIVTFLKKNLNGREHENNIFLYH
jgi:hypothetical protein